MATYPEHMPLDDAPDGAWDYEQHAAGCPCDECQEEYEETEPEMVPAGGGDM